MPRTHLNTTITWFFFFFALTLYLSSFTQFYKLRNVSGFSRFFFLQFGFKFDGYLVF